MRIAVTATACSGKTKLIESFLQRWDMYKTPSRTYRDIIKEQKINLNKNGDLESQRALRDALIDQAIENASEEFCIHDRCILDNLAYTLWQGDKGIIKDGNFISESMTITQETLKMYDIIFYIPLSDRSPVVLEEKETRDLDMDFRMEIDNIFASMFESFRNYDGLVFPLKDSPTMIEVYGDEEAGEKTNLISCYINEDGRFKTTDEDADGSVFKTLQEIAEQEHLERTLLDQVK